MNINISVSYTHLDVYKRQLLNYPEDFYLNKSDYNSVRGYNCIYKEYQIMEKHKQICDEYELSLIHIFNVEVATVSS